MSNVAFARDDNYNQNRSHYSVMAKTVGQRLVEFLVPRTFRTLQEMQIKTELAYTTVHHWKSGRTDPRFDQLETIARAAKMSVNELLDGIQGRKSDPRLDMHPDWAVALESARKRYKNKLPDYAFIMAGATCPAVTPEHLDEHFLFDLAEFWLKHGSDESLMAAEENEVRAEIEAERKKHEKTR